MDFLLQHDIATYICLQQQHDKILVCPLSISQHLGSLWMELYCDQDGIIRTPLFLGHLSRMITEMFTGGGLIWLRLPYTCPK